MYDVQHFAPWEVLPDLTEDATWANLNPSLRAQIHPL